MTDSIRQEAAQAETEEHEPEDRLSKLPDDILMHILGRLELLRDAIRTSVLSKRWRHLPGFHSEIVLDVEHFQPEDDSAECTLDELVQANVSLVEATKSILAHKSKQTISYLSLRFYLRDESKEIFRSVDNVMANREVTSAEFKILPEILDNECTCDDMITYGRRFMTFFDAYPRAFGGLTDLYIQSLRLNKSDIPNVLGTCKKLEYLSLQNCDIGIRSVLQIEHSQLAELCIIACRYERIELKWLPKLTHVTCRTWFPSQQQDTYPLSFGYVPQLSTLILNNMGSTLHKTFKLSEFLHNVVIAELDLNFQRRRIWIQPEGPQRLSPLLKNLQMVRLRLVHEECDLTWTMFFLEAAPLLKEINIQVWDHKCPNERKTGQNDQIWQKAADYLNWSVNDDFKHYNLSKLTIEGFQVEEKFTRYIKQAMKAAVDLGLVSLLESRLCGRCRLRPSKSYPQTDEERDQIRKQISEWRSSPINIKFGI